MEHPRRGAGTTWSDNFDLQPRDHQGQRTAYPQLFGGVYEVDGVWQLPHFSSFRYHMVDLDPSKPFWAETIRHESTERGNSPWTHMHHFRRIQAYNSRSLAHLQWMDTHFTYPPGDNEFHRRSRGAVTIALHKAKALEDAMDALYDAIHADADGGPLWMVGRVVNDFPYGPPR